MQKKSFLLFAFAIIVMNLFAQKEFLITKLNGVPFSAIGNGEIEGSPYLFNDWKTGTVILDNKEKFENIKLKFDTFRKKFFYNQHDSLFEFVSNISEIRLKDEAHPNDSTYDMVFKNLSDMGNADVRGFVQDLCSGKVTIVKEYKTVTDGENSTNGIMETHKKFVHETKVLSIKNNKVEPVKFNSRSLDDLVSDKKEKVDNYIKSNKLNIKNEKDFIKAIQFYNDLSS